MNASTKFCISTNWKLSNSVSIIMSTNLFSQVHAEVNVAQCVSTYSLQVCSYVLEPLVTCGYLQPYWIVC